MIIFVIGFVFHKITVLILWLQSLILRTRGLQSSLAQPFSDQATRTTPTT